MINEVYAGAKHGVGVGGGGCGWWWAWVGKGVGGWWVVAVVVNAFSDVCATVCDVSTVLLISATVFNGRGTKYDVGHFFIWCLRLCRWREKSEAE